MDFRNTLAEEWGFQISSVDVIKSRYNDYETTLNLTCHERMLNVILVEFNKLRGRVLRKNKWQ